MLPKGLSDTLHEIRRRLATELPGRIRRIALFGSWARGEADEDSDVDLLVVIADATSRERLRAVEIAAVAGLEQRFVVELVALSDAQWDELVRRERSFAAEVQRDAIEVAV